MKTSTNKNLPLEDVNVHIKVVNGVASFELRQVYKNEEKQSLEIEYNFPINPEYSVTALNVKIGDKTVEGKVIKKEKAEEKYDDAIAAGHTAVKMDYDETTKGMMKMKVGNLLPK
jgi:Ca-activated chloride channel family protein